MQNNLPKYILTKENTLREDPNGNITFVAQAMEFAKLHAADAKTAWAECEALRGKVAALEAALSAAEPVAWLPARRWEQMTAAEPWLTNIVYSEDQSASFPCIPLYTSPVAPSVAM